MAKAHSVKGGMRVSKNRGIGRGETRGKAQGTIKSRTSASFLLKWVPEKKQTGEHAIGKVHNLEQGSTSDKAAVHRMGR